MHAPVAWMRILTWLLAFKSLNADSTANFNECSRGANQEVESCIPIKQCRSIIDYIQSVATAISPDIEKQLQKYHCGYERRNVKVCCPNAPMSDTIRQEKINLLPKDCGLFEELRIIEGDFASLFEVPWIALLSYETANKKDYRCAGSIINDRYILTSAQCLTKEDYKLMEVRCGEHNLNTELDCDDESVIRYCTPPVQDRAVEEIIPHPSYDPKSQLHDIGLIRLATPLNFSEENVRPICLPIHTSLKNFTKQQTMTMAGWGLTDYQRAKLRKMLMKITPRENCEKAYAKYTFHIDDNQICANQTRNQNSCYGDTGSPLAGKAFFNKKAHMVQYGILSVAATLCEVLEFPFVYTNTEAYLDWILSNIRP